jgi:uncharacterized hydrophobic protein (TIGR00271 family)
MKRGPMKAVGLSSSPPTEPKEPTVQMDRRPPTAHEGPVHSFGDLLHGGRVEQQDLDDIEDKLWFDREPGRDPYVRFGVLLVLSVVIATGGVLSDSTATVIGAMIVAPLMTPIMASALAVVVGDVRRLGRSLLLVVIGVGTAIGLSFVLAAISPIVVDATTNSQVAGRISPRLSDLAVALASGAAGAFALSRPNVSDSLPGVAIAISLVPPLCVVGVMFANGDPSASTGAMILFLTNFLAILVAGGGTLAIMGYGRVGLAAMGSNHRRRAAVVIGVATALIAVPLALTGSRIAQETRIEFTIRSQAGDVLGNGPTQLASVKASRGVVEVTLEGPTKEGAEVADDVANRIHEARPDLDVKVFLLDTQLVEIRAT